VALRDVVLDSIYSAKARAEKEVTSYWRSEPVGVSVYLVTNKVNGKQYVGYTNNLPEKRWSSHKTQARKGSNLWFHQALRKYGEDAFDWRVVSVHYTDVDAKRAERALIAAIDRTYNMTDGGDGCGPLTEEHKQNISASLKNNPKQLASRHAAVGCGVGKRTKLDKLHAQLAHIHAEGLCHTPEATAKRVASTVTSWQDPEIRAAREAGLRAAAQLTDQFAKGQKISAAKSAPEAVKLASDQGKARVQADGGAQIRAAVTARWASPGASERGSELQRQCSARRTPEKRSEMSRQGWRMRRLKKAVQSFELNISNWP
jgi:group I intron endonuclease